MRAGSGALTWGLRLLLASAVVFAGWAAARRVVALEIAEAAPDFDGFSRAIEWDPANPEFFWRRGRIARDRVETVSPDQVDADFRRAVQLNPHNWFYWADLGFHEEVSDRLDGAKAAFRKAADLSPTSGYARWNLANFLLRRGNRREWLQELGAALKLEARYLDPAAALLLQMGASVEEADSVWPTDRRSRLVLLTFLARRESAIAGLTSARHLSRLWGQAVAASNEPMDPLNAQFYLDHLLESGRAQEAREVWSSLMRHNGLEDPSFAEKSNYVWNGGFEHPIVNRGLGWYIEEPQHYRIGRTTGAGENRTAVVKIEFDGGSNTDFRTLRQTVVVDPGSQYRFSFQAKSDRLGGGSGLYFQIGDLSTGTFVRSEEILGSRPWRSYEAKFRVPPGSRSLLVDLRRDRSPRLSGALSGTIWLDDVRLEKMD